MEVDVAVDAANELGEGPLWDYETGALYWLDIVRAKIFRMSGGRVESFDAPPMVSSISKRSKGGYLLTSVNDLYWWHEGKISKIASINEQGNRFNDAKCDPSGVLWAGTMDLGETRESGSLYRIGRDLRPERVVTGLIISNGLGWSPDGKTMYHADTPRGTVYSYEFSEGGRLGRRRPLIRFDDAEGLPDGLAVDEEGFIWVAHWGGGKVSRWSPDGMRVATVNFPTRNITSITFGGNRMDIAFVTSAKIRLNGHEEHSGAVFTFDPGVKGLRIPPFAW